MFWVFSDPPPLWTLCLCKLHSINVQTSMGVLKILRRHLEIFHKISANIQKPFICKARMFCLINVENVLKSSMDLIPSVKIQIMGGEICLRCKGKSQKTFENKKFDDITQQCFALLPQVNFPANNLNFYCRYLIIARP